MKNVVETEKKKIFIKHIAKRLELFLANNKKTRNPKANKQKTNGKSSRNQMKTLIK